MDDPQKGAQNGALRGLRALDLSESVAGQFCGRMLADYGAQVTLIEPPGGSAVRRMAPFDPRGGESLLFFHVNTGKDSLLLDRAGPAGVAMLAKLAAVADVLLVGRDEDVAALQAANPRAVICVVSGFGRDGPWRDWQGGEMIYQALSGMMNHNGRADGEPLYGCGQRASHAAGIAAYIAVLAALQAREVPSQQEGGGQVVEIDVAETASAMWYPYPVIHAYSGWLEPRGERGQPVGQVCCADGDWVCIWVRTEQWAAACAALQRPELAHDPRFANPGERQKNWQAALAIMQEVASGDTADVFLARWQGQRLIGAKAQRPLGLWQDDPHLRARGFWEEVAGANGPRPILGPQFRLGATPRHVRGGPPGLGKQGAA